MTQGTGTKAVSLAQGLFYLVTGIWPVVHLRSFEWVSGPKHDGWLVKTVGALIAVVGAVLTRAGLAGRAGPEVQMLATGSAAALAAVDVIYVARRRISPIYLLDALAEAFFLGAWGAASLRKRQGDE